MRQGLFKYISLILVMTILLSFTGVYATWIYVDPDTQDVSTEIPTTLGEFRYGMLYITKYAAKGGSYSSAQITKTEDLDVQIDVTLNKNTNSTAVFEVTFYNNTSASFYYNKTETVSSNNTTIDYTVSGIESKDEILPYSFKTVQVTFAYIGNNTSAPSASFALHFNFVVDKNSITDVVAQTALDRFNDILNNKAFENSYAYLVNSMDSRSGLNKASAITYIGNVSGSNSADSQAIKTLFGDEFMSMDLDGDGKAEPITMMIKRENLDGNTSTGDSYTYESWGRETTVHGVEMTLYITAENPEDVSNPVVYAAVFTKAAGSDTWTLLLPLTKGSAKSNNYSGFGSANSFNTDTWKSVENENIETLVSKQLSQ